MFSNSVAEQQFQDNPFDDGVLCNSPTPLATSTAKKKLNTLPCTSYTQAAAKKMSSAAGDHLLADKMSQIVLADQSTDSVFKHPGIYLPGGTGIRQTTGKQQSETRQQQKSQGTENLPIVAANENTKLDTSDIKEQSIVSNASSMGLLPEDLLNSESEGMLVSEESSHFTKSMEPLHSSDLSDIEQARRCPAEDSFKSGILNGSHFASAHAFLQLQGMKRGIDVNVSQPKIVLGEEEIIKLDKDFGLEGDDTVLLDNFMTDSTPMSTTPIKMELNDVGTNVTKLIETHGNKQLEEFSYCSSLGVSQDNNQSFSLEKMLRGNKPEAEEKPQTEDMSRGDSYGCKKSQTFSCNQSDNGQIQSTKLYDEDPFETELAYRTEFDADLANIQNVALSSEFVSFESAAAKLDADEAEFFGENANPDFDEVLQVPLAHDVENWSYHTHISFSTPTNHERMSVGTYMHTRSESIKNTNQSLFNFSQAETELPILEELEEEDDLEDVMPGNTENGDVQSDKSLPPPVLAQSIISNSLISNILDMASMSMSNDEIANRFVAQLDKCQRSQSGAKRDVPSLKSNSETPVPLKPSVSQSEVSSTNLQSKRISDDILESSSTLSTPCSTHTLIDQNSCTLEECKSSLSVNTRDQSYGSPVTTKSNQLPSPNGMKFRTPRESMYMPRVLGKCKNISDESKLNCHLKFDDTEQANAVVGKEGLSRKSSTATSHQKNNEEVMTHILEKSGKEDACLSPSLKSQASHKNEKDSREFGIANKSLNDLSAVMSAMMNVTDTRKIQAIMNRNHDDIDETCPWQTIMEEPLGQTQINFNIFSSTLLEDEGSAAGVKGGAENFLASVGIDALKRKPKFEIDRVVKIPDCTIGISEKAFVTIRNMVDRWLECHIDLLHLFVNGREVSIRTYNPFRMKEKLVLGPMATQKFEVVFFPKESGSYMADVRVSSGSHKVTPDSKTHDNDDHVTCYMKLNSYADLPSIHFSPKELDFGQQSWGSTGCLPVTVANKSKAKIPLRLVIASKSSNVFRWGHKTLPDMPGSESKYTVVSDNICCVTLPGAQTGCVLDMTSLDIVCDLVKKNVLKDPNQSTSLIGVVEIQLDVPSTHPPLGIIQLVVKAGTAKLHVSNGADLIVMETSISKPANRTVTLRNAGTLDLHVALDISRHEQVFTLDSGYLKIPVGEKADVNIAFHPQDDNVKSYNVEMMMFMEPSGPVFGIPVQGKVMAKSRSQPRQHRWLLADLSNINFGGVPLGQPKEITLRLKNSSSSIAKIELVMRSEAKVFKFSTLLNSFTRLSDSKSIVIQPNEVYSVTVAFNPTRASIYNGKINIKSSDDSTRFVIPLLGYGGLSEVFLNEPRSGILKISPTDAKATSSQTANFTLRNSGIRDAFFCVQIYQDSDKSVLADKQAYAIHPQNGILKSLEKNTITLLCNQTAMTSLPVHLAIYHGDEEARQQMKRALKKFPNQRGKWKWSEWFDTVFTNEDESQSYDLTLSQRGDLNIFFNHLSTMELTVELSKKTLNNRWSCKNQKADLNSKVNDVSLIKEKQAISRATVKPLKEMVKKDLKLEKHLPNRETDKENLSNTKVKDDPQTSSGVHKPDGKYSTPVKDDPTDQQKIWRLLPEQLTFVSKDAQTFSIINFGDKSLNFQLSWATDRMSVSNSVLTINSHAVSEISVSPYPSESWEGFIYVTAESHMQKVAVRYKGYPNSSNRQPLLSKSDHNCLHTPTILTNPETRTVEFPLCQNSDSNQPFHSSHPGQKPYLSDYSKLLPPSSQQPSVSAIHGPDHDSIELSPVVHSMEQTSPLSPSLGSAEEEAVDVRMTSEIIQFYVESGCDLVNNYLEFTNFGKTNVNWALSNQSSFPYFSSNDGKRTVMKSYDIFKIFQREGTLFAGQTCRVHILFYPEMLFDKKFVCYHACELICQQANASSNQQPAVIPFLLQGFLTSDRCSLTSLMSDTHTSMSSMISSVASSTAPNPTSSCYSEDKKLILQPGVVTFQPCPVGKLQQIKVEMKNRNSEPVKVIIEESCEEDVFSVSVKSFVINPKKLVKIPILFKPTLKGFANSQMIFSSGKNSLPLQLFGVGY